MARSDSLNALQALQAAKDKKDLLWVILGIVGSALAFLGGKQVYQQWSMKKMQKNMMDSMKNMMNPGAGAGLGNMMNGMTGANNPLGNIINQQQRKAEQAVRRTLSKEAEAARQKLMQMKHKDTPMAQTPLPNNGMPHPRLSALLPKSLHSTMLSPGNTSVGANLGQKITVTM